MVNLFITALTLGFLGSIHCAGMCGPLMLFHFSGINREAFFIKFIIYQISRVLGYALLGMMFGQLGFIGHLIGIQQIISLVAGIVLLFIGYSYFFPFSWKFNFDAQIFSFLNGLIRHTSSPIQKFFIAGFINGFLPCGFSFIALSFATTTYSMLYGALFMIFFGLANIPALLAVSLISQKVKSSRSIGKYIMPVLALITGTLLVLRSMNLNIPYISPNIQLGKQMPIIECHK